MSSLISFNPMLTTQPPSGFEVATEGFVQGTSWDNPSAYMYLESGVLSSTNSSAMIGGLPIEEIIANNNSNGSGQTIQSAATNSEITGFATFDRNYAAVQVPGNGVPLVNPGMSVAYYRLGRGARIALQVTPALAAALAGGSSGMQVSWNFTSNMLDVYDATTGALPVKIVSGVNSNSKIVAVNGSLYTWAIGSAVVVMI